MRSVSSLNILLEYPLCLFIWSLISSFWMHTYLHVLDTVVYPCRVVENSFTTPPQSLPSNLPEYRYDCGVPFFDSSWSLRDLHQLLLLIVIPVLGIWHVFGPSFLCTLFKTLDFHRVIPTSSLVFRLRFLYVMFPHGDTPIIKTWNRTLATLR